MSWESLYGYIRPLNGVGPFGPLFTEAESIYARNHRQNDIPELNPITFGHIMIDILDKYSLKL